MEIIGVLLQSAVEAFVGLNIIRLTEKVIDK